MGVYSIHINIILVTVGCMSAILFLFYLPHTSVGLYVTTFLCVICLYLPFLVLFFLRIRVIVSAMSIQHEGPHVAFFVMQIFWQQTVFK